ncbi:uncharacterized protein LOC114359382 [Ostrinia furnacalis]|uniref:uncharacterized protein LOC114359382 n=1 Tax=Ostrinia furnacalis TaxID=93504 RepID=UPI0010390331|nr:uncharacterized protein LOC114359382 [Ostrinia furnacalis]
MWIICYCILSLVFLTVLNGHIETSRQRRYLVFTQSTQWGVFGTVSVPLHPEATVSVAWFFEANYYTVDNGTWLEPLLGDIGAVGDISRKARSESPRANSKIPNNFYTRANLYAFIESMLEKYGYPGRSCLMMSICENASAMFHHNGVVGDLLHLILTPSASMLEEEVEDSYYEAEYYGMAEECGRYSIQCPESPLDLFSVHVEKAL